MKENEIDKLFRSNADYLADQPHRDFDPEAFWQQLQPSVPVKSDRNKRAAWWYWASAASVLLALLMGGIWWMESAEPTVETRMAEKIVPVPAPKETGTEVLASTDLPGQETPSETSTPEKKSSARSTTQDVAVPVTPSISNQTPLMDEKVLAAANEVPLSEAPAMEKPDSLSGTTTAAQPPKPRYRIVHSNELNRQKETETKARAQVVFRIGLPGSGSASTETRNPLAIPISN